MQCIHDPEFTVDRMGRRQQFCSRPRLGAQHITLPIGGAELERGIGLAALELLNRQFAGKAVDVLAHIRLQCANIEFLTLRNWLGTHEVFEHRVSC